MKTFYVSIIFCCFLLCYYDFSSTCIRHAILACLQGFHVLSRYIVFYTVRKRKSLWFFFGCVYLHYFEVTTVFSVVVFINVSSTAVILHQNSFCSYFLCYKNSYTSYIRHEILVYPNGSYCFSRSKFSTQLAEASYCNFSLVIHIFIVMRLIQLFHHVYIHNQEST